MFYLLPSLGVRGVIKQWHAESLLRDLEATRTHMYHAQPPFQFVPFRRLRQNKTTAATDCIDMK